MRACDVGTGTGKCNNAVSKASVIDESLENTPTRTAHASKGPPQTLEHRSMATQRSTAAQTHPPKFEQQRIELSAFKA